ncbi:MAG TPA: hypothetical protein VGP06_12115 [Janthinobacterium sp.]|nr:hypothetical protein [Janthinobacterium sp.]
MYITYITSNAIVLAEHFGNRHKARIGMRVNVEYGRKIAMGVFSDVHSPVVAGFFAVQANRVKPSYIFWDEKCIGLMKLQV